MNILPIIPNLKFNKNFQKNEKLNNSTIIQPKYSHTLAADSVSFSGKVLPENTPSLITNAIKQGYLDNETKFMAEVKKFHGALKRVSEKLKDRGFSFDEEYNGKHPVKSLDSFMDKCLRQGGASDKMRATVYWLNQQDIGSFKEFLTLMEEEGYAIAKVKVMNPKTKKFERFPDLEIRQYNVTKDDLGILGTFLSNAEISRPRSSTYADYQMRFMPKGKGKKDTLLELIMLYGPHYAKAKELESKYVYNIAREFDRLHINLDQTFEEKTPGRRIANNVDVIKTRLREDISKPLFINAYNSEHKVKEPKLPVVISKIHCDMLDGYVYGIRQKIPMYYRDLNKRLKDDEFIITQIKNSASYQLREDKTITPEEIKEKREVLKKLLTQYEADDIGVIATIKEMLKATIKKFGEK